MTLREKASASHMEEADRTAPSRAPIAMGPLAERLGYALRRAQVAVFRDFFAAFAAFEIRPAQYSILTVIEANPGLKQTQVCDALGIKRTNFVAMIDELERRGLVRRNAAPGDRRSHALMLTQSAKDLMPRLHATSAAHEQRLIRHLGAQAHSELIETMMALSDRLEAEAD